MGRHCKHFEAEIGFLNSNLVNQRLQTINIVIHSNHCSTLPMEESDTGGI
jgi:hypothetical protein